MGAPRYEAYPLPAGKKRAPTNNVFQRSKPTGGNYSTGSKEGSDTLVPMHGGTDLKPSVPGKIGQVIRPAYKGRVVFAVKERPYSGGWGQSYGMQVLLRHRYRHKHSDGTTHTHSWYTFYAHLNSVRVSKDEWVPLHYTIGTCGKTSADGSVTGPHCHHALQLSSRHKRRVLDAFKRANAARLRSL